MFGTEVTYLAGGDVTQNFWNSHNDDLCAEDLYANLTVPVFGKGVAYDVPHKVFTEQKSIAKQGLTIARFEKYTAIIEKETEMYLERWGASGSCDLYHSLSELVIFTATHCLHGEECRNGFDETVAKLYCDLDKGFTAVAWFLPNWIPFPSFKVRDRAHIELMKRFKIAIDRRKSSTKVDHNDMMQTFMDAKYENVNNGRKFDDQEISGMLLALLLAGQHTSSTVGAWLGFYIARNPELQRDLFDEQRRLIGDTVSPLSLANINDMTHLWASLRETLRIRPPLLTLMRNCRRPFKITVNGKDIIIPVGNQVCVSPSLQGVLEDLWDKPREFDYTRFIREEDGVEVVTDGSQIAKGGKMKWVPFGAGRHRCIGFEFAQIQIRCIWSVILRHYEISMTEIPEIDYTTLLQTPKNSTIHYKKRIPVTA